MNSVKSLEQIQKQVAAIIEVEKYSTAEAAIQIIQIVSHWTIAKLHEPTFKNEKETIEYGR